MSEPQLCTGKIRDRRNQADPGADQGNQGHRSGIKPAQETDQPGAIANDDRRRPNARQDCCEVPLKAHGRVPAFGSQTPANHQDRTPGYGAPHQLKAG